jgi:hypothetical protein
MIERLEQRAITEKAERCGWADRADRSLNSTLQRGWNWGSESFREKLLDLVAERLQRTKNRNYHSSRQAHDHAETRAENIVRNGLAELGLNERDLKVSEAVILEKSVWCGRLQDRLLTDLLTDLFSNSMWGMTRMTATL